MDVRIPMLGHQEVRRFTESLEQFILVGVSGKLLHSGVVADLDSTVHTVVLSDLQMIRDQGMGAWDLVSLLSVDLRNLVDQQMPISSIRQEWNSGQGLMRRHDDMRPILGISQVFGKLMRHILANRVSVKHFD